MRVPRQASEADIYHVVARGSGKQLIFEDDDDRRYFLGILGNALRDTSAELYAWCLMGNHVHLLVHAPLRTVSAIMHRLCGHYAAWFNERYGRTGHLFQERFRSEPVSDEAYLLTVVRYIHENPQKAGLGRTDSYQWSSYSEYRMQPRLCSIDFVLEVFGGNRQFLEFHASNHDKDPCLDIPGELDSPKALTDEKALTLARSILGSTALHEVKAQPKYQRNACLRRLRSAGFSIRQIERFTGVTRNIVANVTKQ